jgi:large subunit ribosomal protein L4
MLIGGGRAFGPRPKGPDGWKLKVNRKEERLGLAVGLSDKWRGGDLSIVESFGMDIPSTATLATRLSCRGWSDALFILASPDAADGLSREKQCFEKSLANLPNVGIVTDISTMGIWEIIKRKKVIIELSAVDEVIKRLDPDNHSSGFEYDDDDDEDWEGFPELDESMMAEEIEQALKGVDLESK